MEQKPERKPAIRIVPAKELRPDTLSARDYVYDKLGEAPARSKDELKGFGPGGENW